MDDDDINIASDDDEGGGNEWLATYGDLVTLLLCFFVLLFAMSTVDAKKFQSLAASFAGGSSLGANTGGDSILELFPTGDSISNSNPTTSINAKGQSQIEDQMESLYKEVKKMLESKDLTTEISIEKTDRGILLTFKDDLLFAKGKAILKPEIKNILYGLASILKTYDKKVRIEGHTDNVPIKNSEFPSNWELSTARAISVVKYYTEELPPNERIRPHMFEVAGLAEYDPVAPNDNEQNKQLNRRIELIIFK